MNYSPSCVIENCVRRSVLSLKISSFQLADFQISVYCMPLLSLFIRNMPVHQFCSKSTAKDTPTQNFLGQASGGLAPLTPTTSAHSVAGAAGGGLPPQVGDKPCSTSTTPVPSCSNNLASRFYLRLDLQSYPQSESE